MEVTNREIDILTKTLKNNRKYWDTRLLEAMWAYRTTWKTITGFTPYELVVANMKVFSLMSTGYYFHSFQICLRRWVLAIYIEDIEKIVIGKG